MVVLTLHTLRSRVSTHRASSRRAIQCTNKILSFATHNSFQSNSTWTLRVLPNAMRFMLEDINFILASNGHHSVAQCQGLTLSIIHFYIQMAAMRPLDLNSWIISIYNSAIRVKLRPTLKNSAKVILTPIMAIEAKTQALKDEARFRASPLQTGPHLILYMTKKGLAFAIYKYIYINIYINYVIIK